MHDADGWYFRAPDYTSALRFDDLAKCKRAAILHHNHRFALT
jgi:hypothetical protein